MIDIQLLIDRITTETGYTVTLAKETQPNLQNIDLELPQIFVGYLQVDSIGEINTDWSADEYAQNAVDLQLNFSVQLLCKHSEFPIVWETVRESLTGWNPLPNQDKYSTMLYVGGSALGLQNSRLWWVDQWKINFPAID